MRIYYELMGGIVSSGLHQLRTNLHAQLVVEITKAESLGPQTLQACSKDAVQ